MTARVVRDVEAGPAEGRRTAAPGAQYEDVHLPPPLSRGQVVAGSARATMLRRSAASRQNAKMMNTITAGERNGFEITSAIVRKIARYSVITPILRDLGPKNDRKPTYQ